MIDRDILAIWFLKHIALLFGHMMFTNYNKLYFILIQCLKYYSISNYDKLYKLLF